MVKKTQRISPAVYTVLPPGSRLKVECRVYENHAAMLADARALAGRLYSSLLTKNTAAYCETDPRLLPKTHLAIIFFNRQDWSHGMVAHEMYHAAKALMHRRGIKHIACSLDQATNEEEVEAHVMESLVDAFLKKYGL